MPLRLSRAGTTLALIAATVRQSSARHDLVAEIASFGEVFAIRHSREWNSVGALVWTVPCLTRMTLVRLRCFAAFKWQPRKLASFKSPWPTKSRLYFEVQLPLGQKDMPSSIVVSSLWGGGTFVFFFSRLKEVQKESKSPPRKKKRWLVAGQRRPQATVRTTIWR